MDLIQQASLLIKEGKLVAFPTETVYGLGADARNDKAVASIFEAKGRPQFNPLISHVSSVEMLESFACLTDKAMDLIKAFWPGSLTLVLKRREDAQPVSYLVSAGLDTTAVRMPDHKIALDLIEASGCPIAAPSANPSGTLSPTCAQDVERTLGGKVDMILDGGPCRVGVESTVLLMTEEMPVCLRPGGLALEEIEEKIGPVLISSGSSSAPRSPGQLLSHYAPYRDLRMNAEDKREGEAYLAFGSSGGVEADLNLSPSGDLKEAAANLFRMIRQLDREPFTGIAVAPVPLNGLGLAINDRLKRAAYPRSYPR